MQWLPMATTGMPFFKIESAMTSHDQPWLEWPIFFGGNGMPWPFFLACHVPGMTFHFYMALQEGHG